MCTPRAQAGLTLAKALCCWAWQLACASSLVTTRRRRAKASSAAAILSRSPTYTMTSEILTIKSDPVANLAGVDRIELSRKACFNG